MKRVFLKKMIANHQGQTILEVALLFPFFMFLVFGFIYLSWFLTEAEVTRYAAFMAARSYQVYGGQSLSSGKKIYQSVAEDIIGGALPYIDRESINVEVDTRSAARHSDMFERDEWPKLYEAYNMGDIDAPQDIGDMVSYVDDNIFEPRFGVLKVKFSQSRAFPFSDIVFSQQAIAPYRLEERLKGDLGE